MGSAGSKETREVYREKKMSVEKAAVEKFLEQTKKCEKNCNCSKKHNKRNQNTEKIVEKKKVEVIKNPKKTKEISAKSETKKKDIQPKKQEDINKKYGKLFMPKPNTSITKDKTAPTQTSPRPLKTPLDQSSSSSNTKQLSKSCQTDPHPDIPYHLSDPLPPIFSSNLCFYKTGQRSFSTSLPNLGSMCWAKDSATEKEK